MTSVSDTTASTIAGRCMTPKDPTPNITTYFCIYPKDHVGNHSFEDTAEKRRERMKCEGWH